MTTTPLAWRPRNVTERSRAARAHERGTLTRVLPNTYVPSEVCEDPRVLAAALASWDPNAVLCGRIAAHLLWWPELPVPGVTAIRAHRTPANPRFSWQRRAVPDDLLVERHGLRFTAPALTVLDLIPALGARPIDEALRRGAVTLEQLWEALDQTGNRRHNDRRRMLLDDSRDQPWSAAERDLHRVWRAERLPFAHATNHWVALPDGRRAALDLALPELMLAFEADGYAYHGSRAAFEHDRVRDAQLAGLGWQIVRLSAAFLDHDPAAAGRLVRATTLQRVTLLGFEERLRPTG